MTDQLERLIIALDRNTEAIERSIERDSKLTGVLSATQEMQELRLIKRNAKQSGAALDYLTKKRA